MLIRSLVSPSAKDPHPRVRYAFLQSMGRLCESLQVRDRFSAATWRVLTARNRYRRNTRMKCSRSSWICCKIQSLGA